SAGDGHQVRGANGENGVRRARGRPDLFQVQQIFIEVGFDLRGMSHWRNTADREAGALAHEVWIRRQYRLRRELRKPLFIDSVAAARVDRDRPSLFLPSKTEGLRDLIDPAPDSPRRFSRRSGARGQLDDPHWNAEGGQNLLDTYSAGGERWLSDR